MCSSGLEAISCPFSTKFVNCTDLRFTTSPAIATYTLLPAGLLSTVSLYVLSILSFCVIVCCVCQAVCQCIFIFLSVGKFFKNNFSLGWQSKLFCNFWSVRWLVRIANVLAFSVGSLECFIF